MKKTLLVLIVLLTVLTFSCKNGEEKSGKNSENPSSMDSSNDYSTYQGEFIYLEEGAVLKGINFIYGVAIDDMSKELAEKVAPIKKEKYDMVPVVVKGTLAKKPEGQEGWEDILTIKEIVSISNVPAEADIKIEESK